MQGSLLKGIDKKTIRRGGIELIKRVFTYVFFFQLHTFYKERNGFEIAFFLSMICSIMAYIVYKNYILFQVETKYMYWAAPDQMTKPFDKLPWLAEFDSMLIFRLFFLFFYFINVVLSDPLKD